MADTIKITADTSQAVAAIEKVKGSLDKIGSAASSLQTKLAGLFLGATILNAIKFADSVSDLSKATDIAIDKILGFNAAVIANGGSAEGARAGILKLVQSIGDAADGSEETQKSFKAVKVTLTDLKKLSEEDILAKVVKGLGDIKDKGLQAKVANDLVGKSLKGTDWNGLASDIERATAAQKANAEATRAAGQLQDNLDAALGKLNQSILKSIKPLADFVNGLKPEQVDKFVKALVDIGAALGVLVVAATALSWITGAFTTLFAMSSTGIGLMKAGFAGLGRVVMAFIGPIETAVAWLVRLAIAGEAAFTWGGIATVSRFLLALLAPLGAVAAGFGLIASVVVAVGSALYLAAKASDTFFDTKIIDTFIAYAVKAKNALIDIASVLSFGMIAPSTEAPRGGRGGPTAEELAAWDKLNEKKGKDDANRDVRDKAAERALARSIKFNESLEKQRMTYLQLSDGQKTFSNYLESDLKFQTRRLSMTDDEKELADALHSETNRYLTQQNSLQDKLSNVQSEIVTEQRAQKSLKGDELAISKDKVELLVEEEERIKKLGKEYYTLHMANGKAIESEVGKQQRIRNEEVIRLQNLQNMVKAIEDQISRQQQLGDILKSANDQTVDVKFQGKQQGMGPLGKQISDIQENARKAALEAGRAFSATFPEDLSAGNAAELADGLDKIAKKYASISAEQIKNVENSRTWSTGWKEAFNTYKENAYDTATQAKGYFDTFSKGFEDTFVNMVKTGDYSFKALMSGFKDVANSMIADFIRIQAQKALLALIPGGSIFGSLFGMANGGPVQGNVPIMVGERGPELFIPKSAGSIVPNGAMNAASSSGQAMQTIVNYNIQAVDSSSFRSLVARDPSFIYAVTEQGRRSQPTRRLG